MVNTYWMAPKFNNAINVNPILEKTIESSVQNRTRSFFVPGQYEYTDLVNYLKDKGKFLTITNNSKIQLFPASLDGWDERARTYFEALINSLRSGGFNFRNEQQQDLLILFIEFLYPIDSKKDVLDLLSKDTDSLLETLKATKSEPFASDYKSNQMDSEENQKMMIKSVRIFLEFMRTATIGKYFTFKDDNNAIDLTQLCDFYIIHPECKFQFALPLLVEINDLYGGNCGLYYNLSDEAGSQGLFMKFMDLYHGSLFIRLSEESELVNVISPEDNIFIYRGLHHFNATVRQMLDLKSQINDELLENILNSGLANSVVPNLLITKSHLYVNWKEKSNNIPWSSKKDSVSPFTTIDIDNPSPTAEAHINETVTEANQMDGMSDGWQPYLNGMEY